MAEINITANVSVPNGPNIGFNLTLPAEAYDKIDVPVKARATNVEVELPADFLAKATFLWNASDAYGPELSYKVEPSAAVGDSLALDGPHLFAGNGAAKIVNKLKPKKLVFASKRAEDTTNVQVLIRHDAIVK
ncbi:MAG: hypothetical protein HYY24_08710 [Verrucomicrobia bacterium]|nr:hypothetical protein [Verrucomicrobiota bacterium]